jgi:hypothetical protein
LNGGSFAYSIGATSNNDVLVLHQIIVSSGRLPSGAVFIWQSSPARGTSRSVAKCGKPTKVGDFAAWEPRPDAIPPAKTDDNDSHGFPPSAEMVHVSALFHAEKIDRMGVGIVGFGFSSVRTSEEE